MKRLLIIGASVLQLPAIKKAKEMGLYVGVVDYNPKAIGIAYADEYFNISTIDEEGVYQVAKAFQADGIMTLATDMPMRAVSYATSKLGLVGIKYDTAIKATDKGEMIKAFEKSKVEHPWYFILSDIAKLNEIKKNIKYPCISKPVDNAGSRGVMLIHGEKELERAFEYSSENGRNGSVIIEEYLQGTEVSVEIMVVNREIHILQVTDKLTTGAPHFVEMGHSQPSDLGEENINKIKDLAVRAVKAVSIDNGPAHVEIILTKDGPKMVELGARMGGDCITTHLVPLSTGIDMVKATIEVALGREPIIKHSISKASAIRYLEAPRGMIVDIKGIEQAQKIRGVTEVRILKKIGDIVEEIGSSVDRSGFVIASGNTSRQAIDNCKKAEKMLEITVKSMKKILLLGGFPQMIDIVLKMRRMGIYTIVVDRDSNSPAKLFANKSYNVSTDKISELIEICKEEKIDGVFNGFEDFNIHIAHKLCETLNLPFYATEEQLNIITNKISFKQECRKFDIPVIEQYSLEEAEELGKFPYIVKPADSYGSRGIMVCDDKEQLRVGHKKALESSTNKQAIIERFIKSNHGPELFYTIVNGNIHLTATADRYTVRTQKENVPLPIAEVFPSRYREKLVESVDKRIRKMLSGMGLKNGLVAIQLLCQDEEFFVYEMAYRFTGEQHYQLVKQQRGIDISEMMIKMALGEDISSYDTNLLNDTSFTYPSINLVFLLKPGKIKKIIGLEQIDKMPEVISKIVTLREGEEVKNNGDYSRVFMRANVVAKNWKDLSIAIENIHSNLLVLSEEEENMLMEKFKLPEE